MIYIYAHPKNKGVAYDKSVQLQNTQVILHELIPINSVVVTQKPLPPLGQTRTLQ